MTRTTGSSAAARQLVYVAIAMLITVGDASAAVISGFLNDPTNPALVASDGFQDLRAPRFANDDEIARNVAFYQLTVSTPGPTTFSFTSSGFAAGGAEPYFSLFTGSGTAATFLDSNFFDPNIDFGLSKDLSAGSYMFTIGVWQNMSFAENDPISDPTLGAAFTTLGVPGLLGNYFYELTITARDAELAIAPAAPGSTVPPEPTVPEPASLLLILTSLCVLAAAVRQRQRTSGIFQQ